MSKHWDTPFGPSEVICKESLQVPEICKENAKSFTSLEEAARLYAIPHYMKDIDVNYIEEYPYDSGLEAAFIAGAEWQKKQMMKEAVEAYVYESSNPVSEPEKPLHQISLVYEERENIPYITAGHTVQLIIVKDDNQESADTI